MGTIEEIRHANLLAVIAELAREHGERGAIQRLAERMGRSHSQLSQLKTRSKHSRTGKPRNIGSQMARAIEAAAGKPAGWMDSTHASAPAAQPAMTADEIRALIAREVRAAQGALVEPEGPPRKRPATG